MTSASTNLQDQHVVLLGGTSGIGLATAHAALAAGASVTVVSSRSQRVAEALARLGDRAKGHTVDLTNESAVRELFEQLGPFDHLVYSAGDSLQTGALADMDLDHGPSGFRCASLRCHCRRQTCGAVSSTRRVRGANQRCRQSAAAQGMGGAG